MSPTDPRPGEDGGHPARRRWSIALFAVPALCCAGPVLLTALGAGSLGALAGGLSRSAALVAVGLLVGCATVAVALRRRTRRVR